ncbi:hypothetical protein CR513_51680, partial [Mucuna pruriens]
MAFGFSTFALFLFLVSFPRAQSMAFDVTKYGVASNGDITQALTNAWKEACASTSPSKLFIPNGTYKLKQVDLRGPCKALIEVQVDGTIEAPADPTHLNGNAPWISFQYINFFTLSGLGTFDGLGEASWKENN